MKATLVVFWKFANSPADSQDGEEQASNGGSRLLFKRGYSVFNAAQVDGYTPKADPNVPIEQRIQTGVGLTRRYDNLGWLTSLANHREVIVAFHFFTVPTLTFQLLCFFVIEHGRRRVLHFTVTRHPTAKTSHLPAALGFV